MRKFVSIRTKLTVTNMLTISIIFMIVLSVVTIINIRSVHQNILKSEENIRHSMIVKGNTLVNNNSMALSELVADNAFTAICNLVASTIRNDSDVIYGIYMDMNNVAWAYATPENPSGTPRSYESLGDELSKWTASLKKTGHKTYQDGKEVIEFAAPVLIDKQIFGFIRYGISTESMRKLLAETLADGVSTRNSMILILLCLGIGSLTASFFIIRRLSARITHPIDDLVKSANIIASGNYDVPITSDSNDELGLLVKDVDRMRVSIRKLTEELKEQERLKSEMELARKIQTLLLPRKPEISGYEITATMDPSEEVGGDYYDVISVEGYDWLVVGDVSGHGVTAGLVMMMVQTAIHTALNDNPGRDPSRLLSVINKTIYGNIELMDESKHMTIVVLASGKDGIFSFSGLHEDILIRRASTGKIEIVESDGMWIGLEPDISGYLSDDTLQLEPGDCMVLFTDGITEAICEEDKFFGDERLIRIIEAVGDQSVVEIREAIISELAYCEKPDDVTLVVMKRV